MLGAVLGLGFERLITIDVLLYGMSLMLEFVALIVLRVGSRSCGGHLRCRAGWRGRF